MVAFGGLDCREIVDIQDPDASLAMYWPEPFSKAMCLKMSCEVATENLLFGKSF